MITRALSAFTGSLVLATAGASAEPPLPASANPATAASDARPVLVELFTSQGCSSCPKANEVAGELSARPDVVVLSFAVDYWDHLGWPDTFAHPAFTERQRSYARSLDTRVFTPQTIVDGRLSAVGARIRAVEGAISTAQARSEPAPRLDLTSIDSEAATLTLPASDVSGEFQVLRAAYLAGVSEVPVTAGENRGRTITHTNVVTELETLGAWSGDAASFTVALGPNPAIVFVQAEGPGGVLTLAQVPARPVSAEDSVLAGGVSGR